MACPPCKNIYDYTQIWSSSSCMYENEILRNNDILSTLLVAIFSLSLIIRIMWHDLSGFRRRIKWRKHRKIILILLSISMIYVVFNLYMMVLGLAQLYGLSKEIAEHFEPYFEFLNYFIFIIYPFICLGIIFNKFWKRQQQQRFVAPMPLTDTQRPKT